jgi:hypothetical protein
MTDPTTDGRSPEADARVSVQAEAFGARLAQSVLSRSGGGGAGLEEFAARMNLEPDRVQAELAYVSIITMHFCVSVVFGPDGDDVRVLEGFYRALWSGDPWCATERGWRVRVREYQHLLSQPHPDFGRAYGVGRTFARLCGASHDVAVIELGATAFVEQLAPILGVLRSVSVE